jgi:hypothetical protein
MRNCTQIGTVAVKVNMSRPLEEKLRLELRGGRMAAYELARRLWPESDYPDAWRTPAKGGPPSWVRTLGAAIKRYGLRVEREGERKFVEAPMQWRDC